MINTDVITRYQCYNGVVTFK